MLKRFIVAIALTFLWGHAHANVLVNIDKSMQTMTVSVDGVQTYIWEVSTGRYGYDTPNGTYGTNGLHEDWYSKQWNARMPYSIFFTKRGHAIHATDKLAQLGTPASHGCVRLSMENAQTLFNLVKGQEDQTTVTVSGQIYVAQAQPEPQRPVERAPRARGGWFDDRFDIPPPRYIPPPRPRFYAPRPHQRHWFFRR